MQQANSNLTNANTTLTQDQANYNSAVVPANNLAAEQAKIPSWQQLSSEYQDQANALPQQVQYDIFTVGAGYLDIKAAVQSNAVSPAGWELHLRLLTTIRPRRPSP